LARSWKSIAAIVMRLTPLSRLSRARPGGKL
jgi:hypothetical protein